MVGTGTNTKTFHVHRVLISWYSGYFKAALNGGFAEARSGVIKLEIEEPAVFESFVKWLYTQKARRDAITSANYDEYFQSIVKLWIFADRREVPLLMNEMIDFLHQSMVAVWVLPGRPITEIYDNNTEGSTLRRMVVDMYASIAGDRLTKNMSERSEDFTKPFLIDWVKVMIANNVRKPRMLREDYKKAEMCPSFHVHEEGVKCTKKGTKRPRDEMED
jgi:hypothetical protein